jgi:uncharacterized protein (DUF305 family)
MTTTRRWMAFTLLALVTTTVTAQGGMQMGPGGMAGPGGAMMIHTSESERAFLEHMIPHHQEAVDRARELAEITERDEVRALVTDIVRTQTEEIETMRSFLDRWHEGADAQAPSTPMMRDLQGLEPDEADRVFLQDMVMHHAMAVRDARSLLRGDLAEHPEVAALARSIIAEQTREIETMRGWLREWYGADAMPGMGAMHDGGVMPGMMDHLMHGMRSMMHGMMEGMRAMHEAHGVLGMPGADADDRTASEASERAFVEALARAFALGYADDAAITSIEPPTRSYRVTIAAGDEEVVLLIDATTGDVRRATDVD